VNSVLLDSHIVIWLAVDPERVSSKIRDCVLSAERRFVSAVTYSEIALKHRKFPEQFPFTTDHLDQAMKSQRNAELPFTAAHARILSKIPALHKDPFDHMLLAQAINEGLLFATMDRDLIPYACNLKGLQLI
jgi:PIN domain nuclease of toxin-antitoxin system